MSRVVEPPPPPTLADLTRLLADPHGVSELSESGLVGVLGKIADQQARLGTLAIVIAAHIALAARRPGDADGLRPKLLVDAVTHILPLTKARIYELIRKGELAAIKIGKNLVVDPDDLEAFCKRNRLLARSDGEYTPRDGRKRATRAKMGSAEPRPLGRTRRSSRRAGTRVTENSSEPDRTSNSGSDDFGSRD